MYTVIGVIYKIFSELSVAPCLGFEEAKSLLFEMGRDANQVVCELVLYLLWWSELNSHLSLHLLLHKSYLKRKKMRQVADEL